MRILVIGGAGYIGSELVNVLSNCDEIDEVAIYDNLSVQNRGLFLHSGHVNSSKVRFIKGDVLDSRKLRSVVGEYDGIVHLAAKATTPFANVDVHGFEQVNHWGTAELVYALENVSFKTLIYISSCAVYGFSDEDVDRDHMPAPQTAYAHSKLNGEKQVSWLRNKSDARIYTLRAGNVYGFSPAMRFDAVINKLVFDAKYISKINIEGTGAQYRPFIYIQNLVSVIRRILFDLDLEPGVYNAFDENASILDIEGIIRRLYSSVEVQYLSQHVSRGSLRLKQDDILHSRYGKPDERLEEYVRSFSKCFAL